MPKGIDSADRHVGQRVRAYRLSRGMSQSTLGERIGVTFQQIQKYENGVNRIGSGRLQKIAGILGVPIASLFNEDTKGASAGDGTDRVLTEILSKPDAMRLLWAFDAIKDSKQRLALVNLVEYMGRQGS
jgi:transcriptional regulator with XRE-family HTH domain